MREGRLDTWTNYTHDQVPGMICDGAVIFENCEANLRLEMAASDLRNYTALPDAVDYVQHAAGESKVLNPVREFTAGQSNRLLIVRACMLYDPVFPTSGLELDRTTNQNGKSALVAVSAYTHQPMVIAMKLSLLSKLRGCLQYTKGTASVEAAIIFPVVFWAYASMFKYFEAYRAQAVAEKSAYTISDMISRETLAIIPSDMTNARNIYKDLSSLSPGKTALRVTFLR